MYWVFPAWDLNPYLNLLQLAPRAAGYRFDGAVTADELLRGLATRRRGDVVHLHWTTPLIQQAGDERTALARLHALEKALRQASDRGVTIIWTVHNRLPHELAYPSLEVRLIRTIAAVASAVHVMAPHTAEVLSDIVSLDPDRTVQIAHPTYQGLYDTSLTREQARESFGLDDRDRAVLFLGQIRPYKGVDDLIDAAAVASREMISRGERLVLLLAGDVREMSRDDLTAMIPDDLAHHTHLEFVADSDIHRWFAAADVAVFPYRAILNSGSVHLAATFGVPVLLPNDPHTRAQFADQPWVEFFDAPASADTALATKLADPSLFAGVTPDDVEKFRENNSPWQISSAYRDLLTRLTANNPSPPAAT